MPYAAEKCSKEVDLTGGPQIRTADLWTRNDSNIEQSAAIAVVGVLLYLYTGRTPVVFDVIFGLGLDAGARCEMVELNIARTSVLRSLAVTVDRDVLRRTGPTSITCTFPPDLSRFFRSQISVNKDDLPIAVTFSWSGPATEAVLQYAAEIDGGKLIARLVMHLKRLLAAAANASNHPVSALQMMTADEREHLLVGLNGSTIEFERTTIPDAFEAQVNKAPDAPALKCNGEVITYGALHAGARNIAASLQRNGVGVESVVGVYLENPIASAMTYFGIVMAGGVLAPLDIEWPQHRLNEIVRNVNPEIVVTTGKFIHGLPNPCKTLIYEALHRDSLAYRFAKPSLTPDNAAYIVHTSGSTGLPKGVVGLHRTITSAPAVALPMEDDEVFALSANLSFGAAVVGLFHALIQGAAVLLVPGHITKDLPRLTNLWQLAAVTRLVMVVPQLRQVCLLKGVGERLKTVRTITLVGATLDADLLPIVYDVFPQASVVNAYSCIEVGTMTTRWVSPPAKRRKTLTVGWVLPNIRVYILSPDRSPLPLGMPGEIYVGSADLSRGYLNQPEWTREHFLENPFPAPGIPRLYRTGDIGRLRPNGELEYVGRLDNQVKIRGIRVELDEIELFLHKHPEVQNVAVVAVPYENSYRLTAFVSPKPGRKLSVTELREHLASGLPSYCVPALFVLAQELPLTANGKIDKQNLPHIGVARPEIDTPFVPPCTLLERTIQAVWEHELGFEGIGVNDHFLEIGGDSLLATRVSIGLQERLDAEVPVGSIFECPTIAELAAHLKGESRADGIE